MSSKSALGKLIRCFFVLSGVWGVCMDNLHAVRAHIVKKKSFVMCTSGGIAAVGNGCKIVTDSFAWDSLQCHSLQEQSIRVTRH